MLATSVTLGSATTLKAKAAIRKARSFIHEEWRESRLEYDLVELGKVFLIVLDKYLITLS